MTPDYEALAQEAAGNWHKFDSFAWFNRDLDNPDDWTIVYTSNRDSGVLDLANEEAIEKEMEPFTKDGTAVSERHSHWACGYVDGYSILVYDENRQITEAFKKWCDLAAALEDYPILDEELYYEREYEAQEEAWGNWVSWDFARELNSRLEEEGWNIEVERDSSYDGALKKLFDELRDKTNTDWETDNDSPYIRMGDLFKDLSLLEECEAWQEVEKLVMEE